MGHAEADELGVLETGNEAQDARLLAPPELRLEANEAIVVAGKGVLPQLHCRVRQTPRPRIDEADWFHRPEAQRIEPAMRHHFDRQAALEEPLSVEVVNRPLTRRGRAHRKNAPYSSAVSGQFR